MKNLAEQLKSYSQKDYYPFHMPGHKRNPFSVEYEPSVETDITEIEGFDNLHHAEGVILEAQQRAAALFHTQETLFSVNGSTAALLSAISACVPAGGKLLMARNCHKAVYHAVYLRQLEPVYLYPEWEPHYGLNGGMDPKQIKAALEQHPDARAVIITSPTYDGIVSDVGAIADICHEAGVPLIVDEAHGAHFIFHSYFPDSALQKGADVVIQSIHKTLPSMTQTALLHRNSARVSSELLHRFMGMYQSSSPSYPLMASIDSCVCQLARCGESWFAKYVDLVDNFYQTAKSCGQLSIVGREIVGTSAIYDWDASKVIVTDVHGRISGKELYRLLLEKYHLQMEMEMPGYVLAITSVGDTKEGFRRFADAILEIDAGLEGIEKRKINQANRGRMELPARRMKLQQAMDCQKELVELDAAEGRVSSDFISLYPPGIPLIVPGEEISAGWIAYIRDCLEEGLDVHGLSPDLKIGVVYE